MTDYRPGTDLWKLQKQKASWDSYLFEGETLLWEGQPGRGLRFDKSALGQSGLGLFFFVFSLFWIGNAISQSGLSIFPLFGLPFLAVGAYYLFGHLLWDAYTRSRTRYALTSERALIAKQVLGRRLETYPINPQTQIVLDEHKDRSASVFFAERRQPTSSKQKSFPYRRLIGFRWIKEGMEVYRLMSHVRANLAETDEKPPSIKSIWPSRQS